MSILPMIDHDLFNWVVLPLLIFISRIFDVSIGTMRIIFVSRGKKFIAPFLGFFEVFIWLVAISQIMQNLSNIFCYLAYAGGFAMGTFIGLIIEEKLAIGILVIRVILVKDECKLVERLSSSGYGVTVVGAKGVTGDVKIVYTIVRRKDKDNVISIINQCNSNAFYSIEDARAADHGVFPLNKANGVIGMLIK
ncbi:DUF2179 domain-containing protein [Pseudobacteroides cellulosolvens]|uniref:UPF0316 protein Bccel_2793 n=1 Tax=Pseudobacteroides cellulosolvens ATCC 35603 = DSM 2933 TaxID=398512 RepID=A0A0L6JQ74_9FIRM|nr:UPF0316 protein [Pseudobacteroides cellulosolvens ATCC 35603 = DSM 2933]